MPGERLAPPIPIRNPSSEPTLDSLFPESSSASAAAVSPGGGASPVVLARKYRPRQFGSVIGQEVVVAALQHGLAQGRIHHAYLLTGSRGVGKTTLARILAKALNCESGVASEPCGQCGSCLGIDAGRFVDYLELDAASNRGVGEIQQLLEQSRFAPTAGRTKVFVIDEVHMLSGHAFNAMLKTLEEPPPRVIFVLATTDPQKIPVTVLSRCLQFSLRNVRPEILEAHLSKVLDAEGVAHEPEAVRLIAQAGQGSVRDALSLTDQAIAVGGGQVAAATVRQMLGRVGSESLLSLLRAAAEGRAADALGLAESLLNEGALAESILEGLARLVHEISVGQVLADASQPWTDLAQSMKPEGLQLFYQILVLGRRDLGLAPDETTGLRATILRLLAFRPDAVAHRQVSAPLVAPAAQPRKAVVLPSASGNPPALPSDGWPALAASLRVVGLTRQLALQSTLERWPTEAGQPVQLRVASESLADPKIRSRLAEVLSEVLSYPFRVEVLVGAAPAQVDSVLTRRDAEAARALGEAEATIAASPLVKSLLNDFQGKILPGSIRPRSADANPHGDQSC